jgi:hypothetical protein
MDLGCLAPASEVTGSEDIPYHFRKGMVCQFLNGMVCPPATFEAGARRPRSISNYWVLCPTIKTTTLEHNFINK